MGLIEEVNELAAALRTSGDDASFEELTCRAAPFLRFVRRRFRFEDVPIETLRGDSLRDIVQEAVTRHLQKRHPFTQCLQNAYRDDCRRRRRERKLESLEQLVEALGLEDIAEAGLANTGQRLVNPEPQPAQYQLVSDLLRRQDPRCQFVVLSASQGATHREIAAQLGSDEKSIFNVKRSNIRHIRDALSR